jgi:hypothetical protein
MTGFQREVGREFERCQTMSLQTMLLGRIEKNMTLGSRLGISIAVLTVVGVSVAGLSSAGMATAASTKQSVRSVRSVQGVPTVPPTVAPASSGPLIPVSREEFSAKGWTIEPASSVLDEVLTAADGTKWRVERSGTKTKVTRTPSGNVGLEKPVVIEGDWAIGVVTAREHRSGASADGSTLVLAHSTKRDRFTMIKGGQAKTMIFNGEFGLDAVANDGSMLFLIETVDPIYATYAVRKADLRTGTLVPGAIENTDVGVKGVTASTSDEPAMRGKPLDRLFGSDGWTYTLYYSESHSYVHALDSAGSGNGLCFDLPSAWNSNAATLRLKLGDETMTVVRKSKILGRLLGTRPGVAPKITLG